MRRAYRSSQELGITLPDIIYTKGDRSNGTPIAGKPVDAGEYWGWLMIEGAKAGAQVTIAKVTPVVKQQPDTTPAKLGMRAGRTTKTTQKLTWEKVEGADGYEIYAAPRNTKEKTYRLKQQRTVKGTKTAYTVKGLKRGTAYRYVVKAYRIVDGEKVYIARSATVRATTKGNK